MSPLEPTKPTTEGPEYCNIAETQDKDLKMPFMNITDKTIQDFKVEIKSI